MTKEKCTSSDLHVNVRAKRSPRFKAGSELSGKVNRLNVDLSESLHEDHELLDIKLTLSTEHCSEGCDIEK